MLRVTRDMTTERVNLEYGTGMSEQPSPARIMQTGLGFWPSKTLLSAIELGLFTELARGPMPFDAVVSRLGLHTRSARDFLDTLVALGFLERNGDRYSNTVETGLFLDRGKPSYVGGILEMANARLYPFWGHLTEGLRTGLPQNEIKTGLPGLFEGLYADPSRLKQFLAAMTGLSHGANLAIAKRFRGRTTGRSSMWARRRGIWRCRSRKRTHTCRARVSIYLWWRRSSKSTPRRTAWRIG